MTLSVLLPTYSRNTKNIASYTTYSQLFLINTDNFGTSIKCLSYSESNKGEKVAIL